MLETESRLIGSKWRLCRHSRFSSVVKNKSTKAHGVSQQAAVKSTEVKQERMNKCIWTTQRTEWNQTISQKFTSCHLYLATFLETSVETVTVWRRIHKDNCGAQSALTLDYVTYLTDGTSLLMLLPQIIVGQHKCLTFHKGCFSVFCAKFESKH